ncbi:MAG: hypothetical protein HC780_13450 [Leptolyngbyaceae cyanobacterium CSU_1_3]|nr:hypothetical protein [Leptolyngbyaceae cyanobacterium CSU_1_3]
MSDPVATLKLLNNLLNAAVNSVSLHEVRIASNAGGLDPRGDIRSASFIRELVKFGVEVARVNPTVTTTGETVISEFLNTLWSGGDERKGQAGLNQFFEGVKTSDERMKLLRFDDRLLDAAQLMQGLGLQTQKKDARFLSQLLNLGSSYAALETEASQVELNFFLDTLQQSQNLQKGAVELEAFLSRFDGDDNQLLAGSRNLLQTLDVVPDQSIQNRSRNPSVAREWLDGASFRASLSLSLSLGESIFDPSGLYEQIWAASSTRQLPALAQALYAYAAEDVQVASNASPVLISQSDVWGNSNPIVDTITLIGGALFLVLDSAGKVGRWVFRSEGGGDKRTEEEKKTDEAVGDLLKGATPTDENGKPLQQGQTRKGKVGNYVKPGDKTTANQEFDEFAAKLQKTPKDQGNEKRSVDLPDGGSAGVYPKSDSTGEPSIQINLNGRTVNRKARLKIRYGSIRATLVIPTT